MEDNISMEKKYDVKEEIYKCSKCGLCKSVCPVYIASKNEMFLSRGRYIVLNRFFNQSEIPGRDFVKNLDVCLNCNACKNFCPSNIDAYKTFTLIKNRFNYKFSFINFSFLLKILLNFLRICKFLYRIFPFKSIFINTYIDALFSEKVYRRNNISNKAKKGKIVYFEGCINKYINESDKNASLNLIEDTGYSVEKIISLCCGYPYLSDGNLDKYKKQISKFISKIPVDVDYIVCSCDTCFDTLKRAADFFDLKSDIFSKIITIDNFLKINNYKFPSDYENKIVKENLYFKPLLRNDECYLPLNLIPINKKGFCSLAENFFMLKHPHMTKIMSDALFLSNEETDGKLLVTSCQLSKIGLIKRIKDNNSDSPVMSYAEYVCKLK